MGITETERDATAVDRPRLLNIMHVVPVLHAGNAGQNFATAQLRRWARDADVTCLVIPGRSLTSELGKAIIPSVALNRVPRRAPRLASRVWWRLRAWFPTLRDLEVSDSLRADGRARALIESANVIVLQWQHTADQVGLLKRLNGHAARVIVLHDVMSQSHRRYARHATSRKQRVRHHVAVWVSRIVERRICRIADVVVVLSEKDARLLSLEGRLKAMVVPAPVRAPSNPSRRPARSRLLLVSSWRYENVHGLEWFDEHVRPLLVDVPDLEIRLVGSMADGLAQQLSAKGYDVRGFVEDLSAEYEQASLAVVPLWIGAGVKFKTIEAALHRVPVVSTTVGAEGIPALESNSWVTDDAEVFAKAIRENLSDPSVSQRRADTLREAILREHSSDAAGLALDAVLTRATGIVHDSRSRRRSGGPH
ncbi:glycosyltransferase family 4 protein [Aestuariimicrobium sp. p3-SID1156]|uniref:glycosyltransferase n=1 Tax=Aestuariimicrobium sp. p3-SID1156 TaxID=2916038 RepID=UPI00223C28DD|nr:glycosyltransferase family 4 protein [Aestuariimicrobium sp. p3-SID1156]MCT1458284.1 glycosyltransferase family 4 protein [Aestuariimicrobium sp. p3-SID1156]